MPDMSDPLDMMESRIGNMRFRARKLRDDAAILIARAEELELQSNNLDDDLANVRKWGGTKQEGENRVETASENGENPPTPLNVKL